MKTRPLFPFYGSKWNIARHYPAPVGRVVEPFAGSAGYALFHGARDVVLVEKDPIIVGLWRYLISAGPAEILALPLLADVGACVDDYELVDGARSLIGFWLNRGSAQPKRSRTAFSSRTERSQLVWGERARARVADSLEAIRTWTVLEGDFSESPDIEATWFIDPPYVDKERYYRCRFDDFARLGAWVGARRGLTIVCEGQGASWLPFAPMGNFKSTKGRATEVVFVRSSAIS